ncbi:lanthionine synthetase C family protein [Solwaraspora sp. WMMA2065]|uniref:lanthionine synthetase C family protein n=1 Tax=Solwaraspora sp. WMMA2065 TaxID=3015166 RepID=UPI00259BEBE7|nr:lanthionine synthetase C family protein [Solwaraspora sp. WMMA2065]WJK33098.1 lanthionine synthetase C family protein [Solwaraspora sp. WMMA2065]
MKPSPLAVLRPAAAAARAVADHLTPPPDPPPPPAHAQNLADGAVGTALLHIERAATGTGAWATAHHWLTTIVDGGVLATPDSSLYRGAPAIAYALHLTATATGGRYTGARHALDRAVATLTHRRVDQAMHRITARQLPTLAEYDLISGLTGIGAHLLRHTPGDDALARVLAYLVRLTEPIRHDGVTRPGWWTFQDPHAATSAAFPGGHANLGLAHGITGPLALLAHAARRGITVDGHLDAIGRICHWLDTWCQHDHDGQAWWPQWITAQDHRTHRPTQTGPLRPSWCYGTPGIARAQQLAGLATADTHRRHLAEHALAACLTDPRQLDHVTDTSLCHGWAGLLLTTWRTAVDATTPAVAAHLPHLTDRLLHHLSMDDHPADGLLDGRTGAALALTAVAHGTPPTSDWDACLLLT